MARKSIGIDLDDTLNNLVDMWLLHYNWQFNDNLTPNDIKTWEIASHIKPECGMKLFDILLKPEWFYNLSIQPNAYQITKWLSQHFDLYIVTAYMPEACLDKTRWVKKFLPHIPVENIIFCNNKSLIGTDYLIDDRNINVTGFKQTGIVFNKPWNQDVDSTYPRMNGWLEAEKYFKKVLDSKV